MGEIADYYIEQQMFNESDWARPNWGSKYPATRGLVKVNEYPGNEVYGRLMNFLTQNLHMDNALAKRYIKDNLLTRGKFPVPNFDRLNTQEKVSLYNIIKNAGMTIEGYDGKKLAEAIKAEKEKGKCGYYDTLAKQKRKSEEEEVDMVERDMKTYFKVESHEEGEKVLVLERGMMKEAVAVSFSFPHYRKEGFYVERKSNVFSKELDTEKMTVDMGKVFNALCTLLNNLLSSEKLSEDTYNAALDGFESFILEALDYSEIAPMLDTARGLKSGKKKRIANSRKKK